MVTTFGDREWKAKECGGKYSQTSLTLLGTVSDYQFLPVSLVRATTFNGCLSEAVRYVALDDQQIAAAMHISGGYMSKFLRGVAQTWARRMVLFMQTTKSLAPLQKMADELGCDVVPRNSMTAPTLEEELQRMKRGRV